MPALSGQYAASACPYRARKKINETYSYFFLYWSLHLRMYKGLSLNYGGGSVKFKLGQLKFYIINSVNCIVVFHKSTIHTHFRLTNIAHLFPVLQGTLYTSDEMFSINFSLVEL